LTEKVEGQVSCDLTDKAQVKELLSRGWAGVVHAGLLLAVGGGRGEPTGSILALIHGLLETESSSRPSNIWLVSQGAQAASGGAKRVECTEQCWLSGFVKPDNG